MPYFPYSWICIRLNSTLGSRKTESIAIHALTFSELHVLAKYNLTKQLEESPYLRRFFQKSLSSFMRQKFPMQDPKYY